MIEARSSITIRRPAQAVYRFLADDFLRNYPRWSPEVVELEALSAGPVSEGCRCRQVRSDLGRRLETTFRVSRLEPGRSIAFEGVSAPFSIVYTVDPLGEAARLSFQVQLRHDRLVGPLEKLAALVVRAGAERVVCRIRDLIEGEAGPRGRRE
jgi:Polyketide cyclase / dehydrase and lipid transport